MINEIDILHERHCSDFACHSGEKTAGLLCVVSYHHKIVVELRKYRFDTFTEPLVCPCGRTPVFLIKPIWNFKSDICCLKEILLNLSTEIAFVSKHHAIMIFPAYVLEIMKVMNTCGSHVKGMDNTKYSADNMELIAIIMQALRSAVSPVGSSIGIVLSHGASFGPCVPAYLYWFRINAEYIFGAINSSGYILADFFCKSGRELASGIELSATDQVRQILLTLMVQTIKKKILAVEAEGLGGYPESNDFKVGKLGNNTAPGYVSMFINSISGKILADSEDSDEICYEVAHKQCDST